MILVDTSVGIDHLHSREGHLRELLNAQEVLMHAMVVGEISCGRLRNRGGVLQMLSDLPAIGECEHGEVRAMIERRGLMGRGMSFIDAHLLCSVLAQSRTTLWTRDTSLRRIADDLGVAYSASACRENR